jgi:hypothetical protein
MKFLVLLFVLWANVGYSQYLPIRQLTPGTTHSAELCSLCKLGYARTQRNVSEKIKRAVFARYQVDWSTKENYECDHLISLELAGDNSVENLWPEPYAGTWNAHVKDQLENRLHTLVCRRQITLEEAQVAISSDWVAAYQKYISPTPLRKLKRLR